ncbi:TetR/AcrR family transcriptional regulator [Novosphingobium sp. FKTRR1]|uniref:TetR/AcrR family transcriptional regulator n=1 Tax=Novosphingobium sp. FKTRR1 TaxID=2879118 RepID=UPI001CF037CA|nr:TetR/AcrR family transcriptional regulator [Novosphingobium sp. FKTRR1]
MKRRRISGIERKSLILDEARRIFSKHGFEAARTQDIARAAQVSEALVYRHFPTKQALYRAVLRRTIRDQNANHEMVGLRNITPRGLITNLRTYFQIVVGGGPEHVTEGFRLLLASVAGDASFASLIYRRANRMMNERVHQALVQAHACGDIVGKVLDARNTSMFTEHIGTMMNTLAKMTSQPSPYSGDKAQLVNDAVWFCSRGLGFTEEAIARYLADADGEGDPAQTLRDDAYPTRKAG